MLLRRLQLQTADLPALARFYADALGISAPERTDDQLTLRVGRTELVFTPALPGSAPTYHFAFNVPAESVPAAAAWLRPHAPLVPAEGEEIVDFPNWQARSVYAFDPAGNIIECIGRQGAGLPPAGVPFSAADLYAVSEIGVVVPDVPAFVDECQRVHGLPVFVRQPPAPRFAAVGDDHGLLIVVPPDRPWFPTPDCRSAAAPLVIELTTAERRTVELQW